MGTTFGDLEGALARRAGERIGVHVARAHRHVPHAERVEVAAALWQDAPEALVVALRPSLLAELHRVAVEHPIPARALDQARALHACPVIELNPGRTGVSQDLLEGLGRA